MSKVLGIVNLFNSSKIEGLNKRRSLASTSFLGRYNFIDFPLSNFSNSNIDRMGILTKEHIRSLIRHVGFGHWWTDNTKIGQLNIMYNEGAEHKSYNHDVNDLIENSWVFDDPTIDYVIFAPADILIKYDFNDLVEVHKKNKSHITFLTKWVTNAQNEYIGKYRIYSTEHNRVASIGKNRGDSDKIELFTEICIMSRDTLLKLLKYAGGISSFFSLYDTIGYLLSELVVKSYNFEGEILLFDTLANYLKNSIKLIKREEATKYITDDWPIYTKTYDSPPVLYKESADVKNSVIANGCVINGHLENCVIGRNVVIEKGCVIKNSVILSKSYIGPNTIIENSVIDKECRIINKKELKGTDENPLFIKKGDIV